MRAVQRGGGFLISNGVWSKNLRVELLPSAVGTKEWGRDYESQQRRHLLIAKHFFRWYTLARLNAVRHFIKKSRAPRLVLRLGTLDDDSLRRETVSDNWLLQRETLPDVSCDITGHKASEIQHQFQNLSFQTQLTLTAVALELLLMYKIRT